VTGLKKLFYKITHWEKWDYRVKYYPLAPVWLWYCLRARSFWWFTPSNPTLTFGGFEGESKREMYEQLPEGKYPRTIYIKASWPFEQAENAMQSCGFNYPFAVKPDVGMMGLMFRKISNRETFEMYHRLMFCDYILQEHIDLPVEVSVFYYRYPGEVHGHITGFIKKEGMQVIGDGTSNLWQLISADDRARFKLPEMRAKHEQHLNRIISKGEVYVLSPSLNLSRGGRLVPLTQLKDEQLLKIFDDLSHFTGSFYYGRYDIKCASIEDLKIGVNYSILEFNGAGAEPHHVYGMGNNIFQAQKILLQHWKILYRISQMNYKKGIGYWKHAEGLEFLKKAKRHFKLLRTVDKQMPV
jgi:hypothetical protein